MADVKPESDKRILPLIREVAAYQTWAEEQLAARDKRIEGLEKGLKDIINYRYIDPTVKEMAEAALKGAKDE